MLGTEPLSSWRVAGALHCWAISLWPQDCSFVLNIYTAKPCSEPRQAHPTSWLSLGVLPPAAVFQITFSMAFKQMNWRISCSSGWPGWPWPSILLLSPLECWDYSCVVPDLGCRVHGTGDAPRASRLWGKHSASWVTPKAPQWALACGKVGWLRIALLPSIHHNRTVLDADNKNVHWSSDKSKPHWGHAERWGNTLFLDAVFLTLDWSTSKEAAGWRDRSVVKSACRFSKGPGFSLQHPYHTSYNGL